MAPLISEDLPCAPESIDIYRQDLEGRKLHVFCKDTDDVEKCEKSPVGGLSYDLAKIILDAGESGRATHGVFDCAHLLTKDPESVMLCVLPDASDHADVTVHIQHTLIQAFCWENEIQMIKVDSVNTLAKLLDVELGKDAVCGPMSCVLIQFPTEEMSPEMKRVSQYIDNVIFGNVFPRPVIKLPE